MSTNHNVCLLYREKAKSTDNNRTVLVFEHDNMSDFSKTLYPTYYTDSVNDVTFCAHTYVRIECMIQYFDTRFEHCEVTITDRFTMESTRFTLEHDNDKEHGSGTNPKYYNVQIPNENGYSVAQFAYDQVARVDDDERINGKKFSSVTLLLSMADFPHFGDIDFQFYGVHEDEKDKYSDPVIVQFTNAPTVIAGNLYKWHPHNTVETPDYDNVFNDEFGAFWDYDTDKRGKEDLGRTNVLLDDASDGYNDVYSAHRLMTNGIRDFANTPMSVYGHPVYIAHYDTFVPKTFSDVYGVEKRPVKFTSEALHKNELGENCAAYLTTSGNYSTSASSEDAFNIRIAEVDDKAYNLTAVTSGDNVVVASIPGQHQRFNAYLGCISGAPEEKLRDGNGTSFSNRKKDDWYRKHTMLHADFSLKCIDPYWLSNTDEIVTDYIDRSYRIIDNYENYIPPVIERVWVNHDWGTRYYVLKKGCLNDRYNPENWIRIYNYPYRHRNDSSSIITENTELLSNIEVDDDGVPILILEHTGDVGYGIDIKHTYYDASIGYTCSFIVSCDDDKKNPRFFKIMDLITTATTRTVIFRVSDMAEIGNFGKYSADAEWAITVPR